MNCMNTVRELLAEAQRVVAFTGAGISVESGVPTFRGPGGLWRTYSAQDLATPEAFARDPKLVWEWYDWRRRQMAEAQPNAGHHALVAMEQRISGFTLVTQNVDGLHDQAGSRNIVKLHGDIWMVRCTGCGRERQDRQAPLPELPPLCECGAMLRPGVVWFGELLPPGVWSKAEHAASRAEVFLTIGTSALVHPAAGLIDVARMGAAKTVEINPDATPYSGVVDYAIRGSAAEVLPQLVAHNTD
jgi:NAD-dependent deacetylase